MTMRTATSEIIGSAPSINHLRQLIDRVAPTSLPVLIQGPTGAGKELVARALHNASGRTGAFVAFNVCAIAETMFEDTLFGHVRGAFTGAVASQPGLLAEAHRGTVFLDEISGLSLQAQAKLLRAIETREFRPLGARQNRHSAFRVVAATNECLVELEREGRFRADLRHRLGGVVLRVPPLRERRDDLPRLVEHFASGFAPAAEVVLTADGLRVLQQYDWPGNVRELKHVVETVIALTDPPLLTARALLPLLGGGSRADVVCAGHTERLRLTEVLEQHAWDTARAAEHLQVHRVTVYRRMQRLGIPLPSEVAAGRTGARREPR